jgi:DNA-binding transcriptional LysR family regulator
MIPTDDNLCFVPIERFTKTRELYLQWHSKHTISPAATAFMELVKDMAHRHAKCHR